ASAVMRSCSAWVSRPRRSADRRTGLQVTRSRSGTGIPAVAEDGVRRPPPEDRKCWQRGELGIHGLKSWGRNWYRKVRETRSSTSQKRPERSAEGPPTLWHQHELVQDPISPVLDGRLVGKRKKPVHEGPAQTMASPQAVPAFRVQALERSRGAAHGLL